jgi:hypothetical protein
MTARKIEWEGEWIAMLLDTDDGPLLVEPIVFDQDGNVVMGREVLAAQVETGQTIPHPILRDYTPGQVAELEQRLAHIRETLGVQSSEPPPA